MLMRASTERFASNGGGEHRWAQQQPASAGPCEPLLAGCSARAERRAGAGQRMTAVPVAMAASMPLSVPAVK